MPPHDVRREAEHFPERPHLVLEKVSQRFDEFKAKFLRKAADIVMQLDVCSRSGVSVAGLNDIDGISIQAPESTFYLFPDVSSIMIISLPPLTYTILGDLFQECPALPVYDILVMPMMSAVLQ